VSPAAKLDRLEEVIVLLTQEPVSFKSEAQTQDAQPASAAPSPAVQSSAPGGSPSVEKP
jgi:hypothetical protein